MPGVGAPRILVAGIGDDSHGDDGFGPAVVRRLPSRGVTDVARVVDYGMRGMHLAHDLLDGWDAVVLVDAVPDRGHPGEVSVAEVEPASAGCERARGPALDPPAMDPGLMLASLQALGGLVPRVLEVDCQASAVDDGVGLTPPVAAAVEEAATQVTDLVLQLAAGRRHR